MLILLKAEQFIQENGLENKEMDLEFKNGQTVLNMKVLFYQLRSLKSLGEWKNNKAEGKGKFLHVDGDTFEGEWSNDKANGWGVYLHKNGAKYEGYWKDDLQHGKGVETWTDGSKYDGYYKDGKKHGKGKYSWTDGSSYNGDWHENKICGTVFLYL